MHQFFDDTRQDLRMLVSYIHVDDAHYSQIYENDQEMDWVS